MTSAQEKTLEDTRAASMSDEGGASAAPAVEASTKKVMVMSVRWFRVVTALAVASTLAVAAIMLPAAGRLATGVLLLLIVSAAVALGWAATRSTTEGLADIDAEPFIPRPR